MRAEMTFLSLFLALLASAALAVGVYGYGYRADSHVAHAAWLALGIFALLGFVVTMVEAICDSIQERP